MTERPSDLANCNCLGLRRAARLVSQSYDAALAPTGLRVTQYSILAILRGLGGATVNELARMLDLDRTTTGKNLRPLERDDLVTVARSTTDGRSRAIALTPRGLATLKEASLLWRKAQRRFEALNGREPAAELRATLAQLKVDAHPDEDAA